MDSNMMTKTAELEESNFPNKIENGLRAAYHFQQLQDHSINEVLWACVTLMWMLMNCVHGIIKAIFSLCQRI
ncbi:hypothetical protein CROQUDRAFT_102501 [Cronartium quercuum f. sp. fusiforme G11]|uniref:Uncharacterized protein n=1 Tax=Cronartium quercuum f. sp. fusiforme G11 TaxID=708437 RepID=A0A9P6T619_9BASI|nr:hypothetical protein CROQUDRAFT_102501 [Cronartium quercuum f. sp. fusiforme G11]